MKKSSPLSRLRIALRGGVFWYKRFVANKLYGAHLDKKVRLSSSTVIDKNNTKGIYIGEYTYLAGGGNYFCPRLLSFIIQGNAYVTKDVSSNCIVAGNPARVIREKINTSNYGKLIYEETK